MNNIDTLYYDGKCALCSREITFLKKHANELAFIDAHTVDTTHTPSKDDLLRVLHLQTAEGKWLTGVQATIKSWSHTPYGFVMRILDWPIIRPLANKVYDYWAVKRYCRLYQ